MKKNKAGILNIIRNILYLCVLVLFSSCGKEYTPEEKEYIEQIEKYRAQRDSVMEFAPYSPFNKKGKIEFHPLKYYEPDMNFVFKSQLYRNEKPDTVVIYGTKWEERQAVRIGHFKFNFNSGDYKLNVYETSDKDGNKSYMSWFTDNTTGEETYGVGRYLNLSIDTASTRVYTIDFNLAFNPYCAYNSKYTCAIPTKEDYINLDIEAGEKKYHE